MTRMYFIGTVLNLMSMILSTVLNLAFALSVLGFLIMHMSLVAGNTTTIEAYEKKASARWRFDLGWKRNFEQVLQALLSHGFVADLITVTENFTLSHSCYDIYVIYCRDFFLT
jgi:hypothetical protein